MSDRLSAIGIKYMQVIGRKMHAYALANLNSTALMLDENQWPVTKRCANMALIAEPLIHIDPCGRT